MSETSRRSGGAGDRRERKERTPREEKSAYVERVVAINRVAKVVKGGRRFSFSSLVVAGERQRARRRRPRQGQRGAGVDPQGRRAGEEEPVRSADRQRNDPARDPRPLRRRQGAVEAGL